MKKIVVLAGALALGCASVPAVAATVSGADITTGAFQTSNVHYRYDDYSAGVGSFSGTYWNVVGLGSVFQVCAELFDSDAVASSYTVTTGISAFGNFRDTQLKTLFSNAYPLLDSAVNAYIAANGSLVYNPAFDDEWTEVAQYSVALQTLSWVIIENNHPTISPTDTNSFFGIFDDGSGDPITTGYIVDWAGYINNGTWTPQDGVTLYYAASAESATQDRVWAQVTVPEPASWTVIGAIAFTGTLIRRRRC